MEPKMKPSQSRKVDPEEAIDAVAKRGRLDSPEPGVNVRQDRTSFKVDLSASSARRDSEFNEERRDLRKNSKNPRGINYRVN